MSHSAVCPAIGGGSEIVSERLTLSSSHGPADQLKNRDHCVTIFEKSQSGTARSQLVGYRLTTLRKNDEKIVWRPRTIAVDAMIDPIVKLRDAAPAPIPWSASTVA